MESTDPGLTGLLKEGNKVAFENVFKTYFKSLHSYAFLIVKEDALAQEIVQHVFYKIWEKKDKLHIQNSLKAYLYKSVYHECMYEMKRKKYKAEYQAHILYHEKNAINKDNASAKLEHKELEKKLQKALSELPEQCLAIFHLSRFEGLKYNQIALQLGLSVKTVENQMGKALKRLRRSLVDFLPFLIYLLWHH